MAKSSMTIFRFADCELDTRLYELRVGEESVSVQPQIFNLLLYLVENRDRVVTKNELYDEIWPGRVISEATLSSGIKTARQAIGDDGASQKYIKTIHGRGFRFVGQLEIVDDLEVGKQVSLNEEATTNRLDEHTRIASYTPAIVVLPFVNLSGDPDQEYFSDGITEDVITELSRFRSLSVIARTSAFAYKNRDVNIQTIGDQLGVDYAVEGSVRRIGNRVRITAQLIEAATGKHVWANRYDREIDDIFDVQDEVTRTIVATVGGRLEDHRIRSGGHGTRDWGVYDLILRAQALHYRILKQCNSEAHTILMQAMNIDPDNARVHSLLGAVLLLDYTMWWAESSHETLDRALMHGRKSIQLDNSDSLAHARLGETLIHINLNEAKRHFEKALELNPNDSESRALYSLYFMAIGNTDRALAELELVRKIDPFERVWTPWFRGEALFLAERYEEAIENFEEVTEPINDLRLTLSACYAQIGKIDTAKKVLWEYLAQAEQEMPNFPGMDFTNWIDFVKVAAGYQDEKHHRLIVEAMRKAWPTDNITGSV